MHGTAVTVPICTVQLWQYQYARYNCGRKKLFRTVCCCVLLRLLWGRYDTASIFNVKAVDTWSYSCICRVYGEIPRPVYRVRNVGNSKSCCWGGYVLSWRHQTCGLEFVWGKWGRGFLHWTCECVSHKQTGLEFELAYCGTENRPFYTGRQSLHRATGLSDDNAWRNRAVSR